MDAYLVGGELWQKVSSPSFVGNLILEAPPQAVAVCQFVQKKHSIPPPQA